MLINPVLFFSLDTFSVQNNICEQCKVVWQINGIILIGQLSILVGQFNFSHQLCRSVYSPAKTLFAFLSISVLHFKNGRISNFPTFSAACILRICWSRSLYDVALHERTISSSHSCQTRHLARLDCYECARAPCTSRACRLCALAIVALGAKHCLLVRCEALPVVS